MADTPWPRSDWPAAAASLDESLSRLRLRLTAAEADLRLARSCYQVMLAASRTRPTSGEVRQADTPLTPQETRVATLVAAGMSNLEVAAALHVSVHTVKTHVKNILDKLQLRSRWQLGESAGGPGPSLARGAKSKAPRPFFTPRAIGLEPGAS